MIRGKNIQPDSILRYHNRNHLIWYTNTQAAYIWTGTAGSADMVVGGNLTLLETIMRFPHSIAFTPGAAVTSAWSFRVTGENQFGETVTEVVTIDTASTIVHTLHCYRKLTSILVISESSVGAETLTIGCQLVVTTGTPKIPMPFKPASTASITSLAMCNASAQPTFTKNGSPYWNISISAQPLAGNPVGCVIMHINEDEPNA